MKISQILMTTLIAGLTAWGVTQTGDATSQQTAKQETAFERVMRTSTLRCAYYPYAPVTIKDPTTGQMSGMAIDIMNVIAQKTGIKIEWTEEITFANWIPGMQAKRFDAVCTPLWADAAYARVAHFTRPLFYDTAVPLIRPDETRFTNKVESLNNPEITVAYQEDNMSASLARTLFPQAKTLALSSGNDYAMLLQNVVARKADVALWDRAGFWLYNKTNPGQLKILELDQPLKLIPCELPVLRGEVDLWAFLDAGIEDLLMSGEMDRILRKWEPQPGQTFLRVASPTAHPTAQQ